MAVSSRTRRRWRLLSVILVLLAFSWALTQFSFGYVHGDEGIALCGAWRVQSGELPHHDFFEIIPPGSFLPTALSFQVFGPTIFAARLIVLLYAFALIYLADRVLGGYTRSPAARLALASLLLARGVYSWPIPSHHWVVDLAQLAAVVCVLRGLHDPRPAVWGAWAGAWCSFACFCLQDQGGVFLLLLGLFVFPWIADPARRWRLFWGWVAGGLAVAALFAIYLLQGASVSELVHQWFVHPAQRYRALPGNSGWTLDELGLAWIGSPRWFQALRLAPLWTSTTTFLRLLLATMLIWCPALLLLAWRRGWADRTRLGLLTAGALSFLFTGARRLCEVNLQWALPLAAVVLVWGLARMRASEDRRWRRAGTCGCALLTIAGVGFALGLLRVQALNPIQVVKARAGSVRVTAGSLAAGIVPILTAVEQHVPPGDPLLALGYNTELHFLTLRPNPTRYQFLVPGYHSDEQVREAIASLRASPRAAVLQPAPYLDDPMNRFLTSERRVVWTSSWGRLHVPR